MLILISDAFDKTLPGLLGKYGEVTDNKDRLAEAEVVLVRSKTKVTKEYIDSAPKLKLVVRGGVGLDNIDLQYANSKSILTYNTAEASTVAVAELAFSMMIALANGTVRADQSIREGKWIKKELKRSEMMGKNLAILGMGRIGTALAIRARAFRMKIYAWHPDVYFSDFAEINNDLDDVLPKADFISMHMPLLPDTTGIINKKRLANFKDGAFLVNTGRGKLIVEEDVVEALKSRKLGGYATDVWNVEPPERTPLFDAPNTLFAPHIGASTNENMLRIGMIIDKIIADFVKEKKK
jgi:D-3-phosphoglycerate dehydrogenase